MENTAYQAICVTPNFQHITQLKINQVRPLNQPDEVDDNFIENNQN